MRCQRVKIGDTVAIVCSSRPKTRRCRWCTLKATLLCDHPVNITGRKAKTCDAPMCGHHARQAGPDLHHCPDHQAASAQGTLTF